MTYVDELFFISLPILLSYYCYPVSLTLIPFLSHTLTLFLLHTNTLSFSSTHTTTLSLTLPLSLPHTNSLSLPYNTTSLPHTTSKVTTVAELEHDEHEGLDAASLLEHEEITKVKNVANVLFGRYIMECWYFSPFPKVKLIINYK